MQLVVYFFPIFHFFNNVRINLTFNVTNHHTIWLVGRLHRLGLVCNKVSTVRCATCHCSSVQYYSATELRCHFSVPTINLNHWLNFVSGVRVIPEMDTPAHVGYGWQFPGSEGYTVCVGKDPWFGYCPQPPCGQVLLQYLLVIQLSKMGQVEENGQIWCPSINL